MSSREQRGSPPELSLVGSYSQRTHACLKQLQQMGAGVDMTSDVRFPNKLYNRIKRQNVDAQLAFVQENLRHLRHLYRHGNLSRLGWNVEPFLITLHSQIFYLQDCVSTNQSESSELNRYYSRLENSIVRRTNGSLSSWQTINNITVHHLYRLNSLVLSIRDATAKGRHGNQTAPERTTTRIGTAFKRTAKRLTRPQTHHHHRENNRV
ncbi:hypothetical protein WMY93_002158 [Mugilogobius chulae]|uniref:Uncharacterized protein n=1 Tax=Mugilogobius chulae TaxID=88201 RepID=A0AAW0Q3Q3_9GOBI